ncbi:unnamed protein product (mitochondrion) [Plasmodiophora brassicae]|uniref:non-specific serine/threonine protein kinase n=1 Tax=Plasmodiophora brassicae TaxID=37360 RepID=A0A0G4J040_PLABS|nr:hypothetical protein PBRA_008310 [Plasmodiophora brassicae]SPQ95289.1 unnamed protein product [Plasmodiophora brassicae]
MGSTLSCSRSSDVVVTSTFESMYEIGAELGKGHFAVVHACVHVGTGVKYAVKVINKRRVTNPMSMREEVTVLRKVGRHPYCIELVDVFEDDSNFYLVMELCTGGDLFSRIVDYGSYSEMDASRTLFQLATALDHIHQQGITHRDLKPENILLLNSTPDSDLKVGDFGLSKIVEGGPSVVMKTICGTWAYCAPEVIEQKPYTSLVDNWTLGVLMFILLSGYHPFDDFGDLPEPELLERIVSCDYSFNDPVWSDISEQPKQMIRALLKIVPEERMSLADFLASPWIQGKQAKSAPLTSTLNRMQSFNSGRKSKGGLMSQTSNLDLSYSQSETRDRERIATNAIQQRIVEATEDDDSDVDAGAAAKGNAVTTPTTSKPPISNGGAGEKHTVQFAAVVESIKD